MNIDLKQLENRTIIKLYSEILKELKLREVIRSKNLVGDLGEFLVIDYFNNSANLPNLSFAPPSNKSYDAFDASDKKYAIKTITNKVTGVFYGLNSNRSTKEDKVLFDYALIVKLDENYDIEKIIQLDWQQFLAHKKWHSRMSAWNLNLSKKLELTCINIFNPQTL